WEPGASEVWTHGLRVGPRAGAFRASRPAPIITLGFEVLVQLVIAAITTEPSRKTNEEPSCSTATSGTVATAAPPVPSEDERASFLTGRTRVVPRSRRHAS